ncbi:leucine-rich repeat-containing G-protein coupled receptor 4-like [Zophobas morio]|uniref:leucine-rich repeat-containing G-protein coupled receptor 4-like n=1 Tax=Zophobas morio TaxID=2755281 RepID=UPI003083BC8E
MSKISVLHFGHNNLTQWDNNWLGGTSKPDYVMAGFNQFSEIPDEAFKNYPKLYSIDLQGNKIRKISAKAFHKLEHVVNFSLRDNEIDSWLVLVSGTIDLSGNKLKCIEGDLDDIFKNNDFVQLEDNPWDTESTEKIKDFTTRKQKAPKTRSYVPN